MVRKTYENGIGVVRIRSRPVKASVSRLTCATRRSVERDC